LRWEASAKTSSKSPSRSHPGRRRITRPVRLIEQERAAFARVIDEWLTAEVATARRLRERLP